MRAAKENIEYVEKMIGCAYHDLKWLTAEEVKRKNRERDALLRSLSNRVTYACKQSKIYCGGLSPGCVICSEGTWSCMYINGLCTAQCFFCPQDRKIKKERLPIAEGITFDDPDTYADYLEKFGFRGVGFSGGESMLVFEKLLVYILKIRKKFGKKLYLWVYTNGDLVNAEKLESLKRAGLNEIRFNISARNYDLHPVELAARFINTVTVEIPAIPEDYEVLKKKLFKMREIGVTHLNLHQLTTSKYNYKNFISRKYTFLHLPTSPVFESEMTALKLMRYALDNNVRLPVNYCTASYKDKFQKSGYRNRAASLLREDFEGITDSGYIRHVSVKGSPANIQKIVTALRKNKCPKKLWALNDARTEIAFQYSLLKHINFEKYDLIIRYFEPRLISDMSSQEAHTEIELSPDKKVFIKKECVAQFKGLSLTGKQCVLKLFSEEMDERDICKYFYEHYDMKTKKSFRDLKKEAEIVMNVKSMEKIEAGPPKIY